MISETMQTALNEQINAELYSSYLYLSMSAWCRGQGLAGAAHWMRMQAGEEMVHALKLFDYVHRRGGKVTVNAVEGPPTAWESVRQVFEHVLTHEQKVTGLIGGLVRLARQQHDRDAEEFLQWYVDEQVEEEESAEEVVSKIKAAEQSALQAGLLDEELGRRKFVFPPETYGS